MVNVSGTIRLEFAAAVDVAASEPLTSRGTACRR